MLYICLWNGEIIYIQLSFMFDKMCHLQHFLNNFIIHQTDHHQESNPDLTIKLIEFFLTDNMWICQYVYTNAL
jgi:hypothetical protein